MTIELDRYEQLREIISNKISQIYDISGRAIKNNTYKYDKHLPRRIAYLDYGRLTNFRKVNDTITATFVESSQSEMEYIPDQYEIFKFPIELLLKTNEEIKLYYDEFQRDYVKQREAAEAIRDIQLRKEYNERIQKEFEDLDKEFGEKE